MPKTQQQRITIREAAERLGVNRSRVQKLVEQKRLPATDAKTGNLSTDMDMENRNGRRVTLWLIDPADLSKVQNRESGWPKGRKRGARVIHGPTCSGTTKSGNPCQNPAGESGRCHKHPIEAAG